MTNYQLRCGDCLELMMDIPYGSVDMVLCDLPYGTTRNHWDRIIQTSPMWECIHHVTKENAAVLLFSQTPFSADLILSNRKEYRYEWIWHKTMPVGFLNANRMPLRAHENILVFYRKLPLYNPQKTVGKPYSKSGRTRQSTNYGNYDVSKTATYPSGERFPVDVITFSNDDAELQRERIHPTQKPTTLLSYLVRTYTNEGETVLDFCMGSGSTGVACVGTGRKFIGIEQDKQFFEKAKKRLERVSQVDQGEQCCLFHS